MNNFPPLPVYKSSEWFMIVAKVLQLLFIEKTRLVLVKSIISWLAISKCYLGENWAARETCSSAWKKKIRNKQAG